MSPQACIDLTRMFFAYRRATVDSQLFEGCLIKYGIKVQDLTMCSIPKLCVFQKEINGSSFTTEPVTYTIYMLRI